MTEISGGELAISTDKALNDMLANYKEVYFYVWVDSDGAKAGTWWCNDTALTAGAWTKVSVYRDGSLNSNGGNPYEADGVSGKLFAAGSTGSNFVFRIMGGAGKTVYLTSLYGVPYADVAVTIQADAQGYLKVSDPANGSYKEGETVTLTHDGAPVGKAFAYFTANGEKIEGNTYTLSGAVEFGVAYTDISTLTLGEGIVTAEGKTEYGRGAEVTLTFNGTLSLGQVFDHFTVDGVAIAGNTFTTSGATHDVQAVIVDNAQDMTWTEVEFVQPTDAISSWGAYRKLGSDSNWVVQYDITATNGVTLSNGIANSWYVGVLFRNDQIVGYEMGDNANYKQYLGSAGDGTGSTWDKISNGNLAQSLIDLLNGASKENPVTLIFIRQGNELCAYLKQGDQMYCVIKDKTHSAFDETYGLDFGYGWRTDCGGIPTIENIQFVTGEGKTGLYMDSLKVNLAKISVTTDKEEYLLGDTVTLTHDAPELGYAFSHYTVDGTAIEGDSFATTKFNHTVEAVFVDVSQTYYIDVQSAGTLFTENGRLVLPVATVKDGNGDVVSGYDITVLVRDASGKEYTVSNGAAELGYTGAMNLNLTYSCANLSGKDVEVAVTAQGKDGTVLAANESGASLVKPDSAYASVEYSTAQKCDATGDSGSVKITVNAAKGNQDYAYIKFDFADCDYVEFYAYTTGTGKQIGCWWYGDTSLVANTWTKVRLSLRNDNVDAANGWRIRLMGVGAGDEIYISSMKLCKYDYSLPVLDVSKGATKGEWTNETVYNGDDPLVDRTGTLKLTPDSNDYYGINVNADGINVLDIVEGGYSEVYFYVYTEATGAKGSVEWAADTDLTAGQWTKITVTSEMFKNLSGKGTTMSSFSYRIIGGNGGTFYVTSLYGVPKAEG